jgi:hypothetical protein
MKHFLKGRNVLILFVYTGGMGSFFLVDFLVASLHDPVKVAQWAATKSVVLLGSSLCLFGLDGVMMRLPHQSRAIFRQSIFQSLLVSVIYVFVVSYFIPVPILWSGLAVFVMACSTALSGLSRARFQLLNAQLQTNLWRFALLLLMFFQLRNQTVTFPGLIFLAVIVAQLVFSVLGRFWSEPPKLTQGNNESWWNIYGFAGNFFLSIVTLNLSIYMEQLLLNMSGQVEASATYFTYTTIIYPVMIAFNGFAGFVLGPYIRRDILRFHKQLQRYWWILPLGSLAIGVIGFAASVPLHHWFFSSSGPYDFRTALIVVAIGLIRVIYILPSSYLGLVATRQHFTYFVLVNIVGIVCLVGGFVGLLHLGVGAVFAVSIANLVNWCIRAGFGSYLVWQTVLGYDAQKAVGQRADDLTVEGIGRVG